jgi:cobalamin biosynthesis protein CobD/CbiB
MKHLKVFINRLIRFYVNIIKSDTGYNSKTFVMVWGVMMITIVLLSSTLLIFIAAAKSWVIPWLGIASFITSLATL